jgi:hypothetical protein
MPKLKLSTIPDEKPVKLTVELPATVHRDLVAYADILSQETGQSIVDPAKLIAPMLIRFMATDRAFSKEEYEISPLIISAVAWVCGYAPSFRTSLEAWSHRRVQNPANGSDARLRQSQGASPSQIPPSAGPFQGKVQ